MVSVVLVSNIKINGGEKYKTKLPARFTDKHMSQIYLRSEIFYQQDVTYDIETLDLSQYELTDYCGSVWQHWSADIADDIYDEYFDCEVTPMYQSTAVVFIDKNDLKDCDDDLKQAVFEKLLDSLPITFVYHIV
jgi:hypothetical protein